MERGCCSGAGHCAAAPVIPPGAAVRFTAGGRFQGPQKWADGDSLDVGDEGRFDGIDSQGRMVCTFPRVRVGLLPGDLELVAPPRAYAPGDRVAGWWRQPIEGWWPGTVVALPAAEEGVPPGCQLDVRWDDGTTSAAFGGLLRPADAPPNGGGAGGGDFVADTRDAATILRREMERMRCAVQAELDGWRELAPADAARLGPLLQQRLDGVERALRETEAFVSDFIAWRAAGTPCVREALQVEQCCTPHAYNVARAHSEDYCSADDLLTQLRRDWCSAAPRKGHHEAVLGAVREAAQRTADVAFDCPLGRCLVPGDGLCRLSYDLAHLGCFSEVQANEASPVFCEVAEYLLNGMGSPTVLTPLAHRLAGQDEVAPQLQQLQLPAPDVWPLTPPTCPLKLAVGPFERLFAPGGARAEQGRYAAVVTCYFIDAVPGSVLSVVDAIASLLAPGGVWVNLGPLHYHCPDARPKLSWQELRPLIEIRGFEVERDERLALVSYCEDPSTHHRPQLYNPRLCVARRTAAEPLLPSGRWRGTQGVITVRDREVQWPGGGTAPLHRLRGGGVTCQGSRVATGGSGWVRWDDGDEWISCDPTAAAAEAAAGGGFNVAELDAMLRDASRGAAGVVCDDARGRHVVAVRPLRAGEVVLRSEPLVATPHASCALDFCHHTFRPLPGRGDFPLWSAASEVFAHYDADKDGYLDCAELARYSREALGADLDADDYAGLCESLGADPAAGVELAAFAVLSELSSANTAADRARICGDPGAPHGTPHIRLGTAEAERRRRPSADEDRFLAALTEKRLDGATRTCAAHAWGLRGRLPERWAATLCDHGGRNPGGGPAELYEGAAAAAAAAAEAAGLIGSEQRSAVEQRLQRLLWKSHYNSFPVCAPLPLSVIPCAAPPPALLRIGDASRQTELVLGIDSAELQRATGSPRPSVGGSLIERICFDPERRILSFPPLPHEVEIPSSDLPRLLASVRSCAEALKLPHNIGGKDGSCAVRWDLDPFRQTGGGAGDGATRQVGLAVHGVASMLNHSAEPSLRTSFTLEGGVVSFTALCDIAQGEEFTFSYGADECAVRSQYNF